tara:strand:+ start:882 stop:1349 length:468 start_codon:yes stop_codon:yes gene_type:complete
MNKENLEHVVNDYVICYPHNQTGEIDQSRIYKFTEKITHKKGEMYRYHFRENTRHYAHCVFFENRKKLDQHLNKSKSSKRKESKKTPRYNIDVPVGIASELNQIRRDNGHKFTKKFVDKINKYFTYFDLHEKLNYKYGAAGAKVLFAMLKPFKTI